MMWTEKVGPDKRTGHYEIFVYWNGALIHKRWYYPNNDNKSYSKIFYGKTI